MTFTYDLGASDGGILAISQVRLELGDTIQNLGVRPDGSNFTDEEIAVWLDEESNHVMHSVIRACLALNRAWSTVANITVGPRREDLGQIAKNWAESAKQLIHQYGLPVGSGSAFAVGSSRIDGYSENANLAGNL